MNPAQTMAARLAIAALWKNNPLACFEAYWLAADPAHVPADGVREALCHYGIVNLPGVMPAEMRALLLESFEGEGFDLAYTGLVLP